MQMRLGSEPGDDGFRREATLSTQLLRRMEALERSAGHRKWGAGAVESLPEQDETWVKRRALQASPFWVSRDGWRNGAFS